MTSQKIKGRVWRFGDNIDTDQIIPAKYCNTFEAELLAPHVMEGADPDFPRRVARGDVIVAGHNFGCGSSREAAPLAIKGAEIGAVIASSFARLFFRNAVNVGLPVLVSPSASEGIKQGDEVEIDLATGIIHCRTSGIVYRSRHFGGVIQEIMQSGGMIEYVKEKLEAENPGRRKGY